MIQVNAMGDSCPIPMIKTKNAIKELGGAGVVETLVDNEIAVQNLTKMARQLNCTACSEALEPGKFKVTITVGPISSPFAEDVPEACLVTPKTNQKKIVAVISSTHMGEGNDELGQVLMKGFLYALNQQETLPTTVLFYNGGAKLTCKGSLSLEDLRSLEAQGVEILTCGTCLNYYGLTDQLEVGQITNMYDIVEKMTGADCIIKP